MKIEIKFKGKKYNIDLNKPIDLSIELVPGEQGANCFYAPWFDATPVRSGDFIGSTQEGGPVNFKNVKINPHGNGTHTECVGHISKELININEVLKKYHFITQLISIYPEQRENGDRVITKKQVEELITSKDLESVIIRTLPNHKDKKTRNYSGTNPPYFESEALHYLIHMGIEHLLTDLPSVDREQDDGRLEAHKAFWEYPATINKSRTITELVYVPEEIDDGYYLLNLQIVSFALDACPSKPIIFNLENID